MMIRRINFALSFGSLDYSVVITQHQLRDRHQNFVKIIIALV